MRKQYFKEHFPRLSWLDRALEYTPNKHLGKNNKKLDIGGSTINKDFFTSIDVGYRIGRGVSSRVSDETYFKRRSTIYKKGRNFK